MPLSIRTRLFLAFGLVVALALAAVTLVAVREQRAGVMRLSTEALERSARTALREMAHDPRVAKGDWSGIAAALGLDHECRVTLLDSAGRVLGDSSVPREQLDALDDHSGRPEVAAALAGREGVAMRHSRTLGVDLLYVALPAVGEVRVLRVSRPLEDLARLTTALLGILVLAATVTLLLALAVVFRVADRQAERVRVLERAALALGADELAARAPEQPADELGRLGATLNHMATEMRTRLAALGSERDQHERILAHMSDGVALVDGVGHVLHMNSPFATLMGAPIPAPPSTPLSEFARVPELVAIVAAARAEGRTVDREFQLWSPEPRTVRATATPMGDGAVLLVAHDLTEMERVHRMRQDFVANVSHELRTPLTSLRGYAETLLDGALDDAERRAGFVRTIRDQAVRLEALVEDLLSLAELERAGTRLRAERFDLREVAAQQVGAFQRRAEAAGLALTLDAGPTQPIEADRVRIEQVLANLLDNALKYTERGEVRVVVDGDAERARLEVRDTGCGIPAADLPRVFERFYRVDKARSRDKGGTGLGLSIVKHIVALHGGELGVESAVGVGSVFRVHLPRVRPPALAA